MQRLAGARWMTTLNDVTQPEAVQKCYLDSTGRTLASGKTGPTKHACCESLLPWVGWRRVACQRRQKEDLRGWWTCSGAGSSPLLLCHPLEIVVRKCKLSLPHGLSISFNPYNNLGRRRCFSSHLRLRYVQYLAQGHRASKPMYWIFVSYWFD